MHDLETLLITFESTLEEMVDHVGSASDLPAHLKALAEKAVPLHESMVDLGDASFQVLSGESTSERGAQLTDYLVTFLWSEQAKRFLILWRDLLFQQQKGVLLRAEGQLSEHALEELHLRSKETLRSAAESLKGAVREASSSVRRQKGGTAKQMERWRRQQNPWPVYREQFAALAGQCQHLWGEYQTLLGVSAGLRKTCFMIEEVLEVSRQERSEICDLAVETIDFIEKNMEPGQDPKPGKVAVRLEDLEEEVKAAPSLKSYAEQIEQTVEKMPVKVQVTVSADGGLLKFKEIGFKKAIRQWLEAEVLPILYEVGELRENTSSGMKMSLVNIRNRALLLAAEIKEGKPADFEKSDISQPLNAFLKKEQAASESLADLSQTIAQRLDADFNLSAVYDASRPFLPLPLQSSINQLRINQSEILTRVGAWFRRQRQRLRQIQSTVQKEENLSISEKVVRLIRHRQGDPDNANYASIFLTKGYIGESFWVGRKDELRHMKTLIDNWRGGFRGAVMITGQRLAGKSLFGDIVAQRYFPDHTIRLAPNSVINLEGRRLTTSYDLGEALEFVRKYTVSGRYLVWIDDLELWGDPALPLSQNVRKLRKYIDDYAGRLFFMVAMSNWLQAHLDRLYEIDKVFQAEVNVSRMSEADIREAILIRHGATHKNLVDDKGREVTPVRFRKMISRIYRASEGNIGEALNKWSYATRQYDDDMVVHQYRFGYVLPELINHDNGLLLSAIMLGKRTNEYRLRKVFGPAFSEKYSGLLQRLISVGLLTRQWDDWLEVNELTVNDLGRQLERKKYLRFHR